MGEQVNHRTVTFGSDLALGNRKIIFFAAVANLHLVSFQNCARLMPLVLLFNFSLECCKVLLAFLKLGFLGDLCELFDITLKES